MNWLFAWAMRFRKNGWFMQGVWYPVPGRWQGWAVLGGFVVMVLATVALPPEDRSSVLIPLGVALIGFAYWTCDDG